MNPKILRPTPHMGGNEFNGTHQAFQQYWGAPLAPNLNVLKKDIEKFPGNKSRVSAGTAKLRIALILMKFGRRVGVFCQSMNFAASANPISSAGAGPVLTDNKAATGNICTDNLYAALAGGAASAKTTKTIH